MRSDAILLTGASGFFGKALSTVLARSAQIFTLSRSIASDYSVDLAHATPSLQRTFKTVVHVAGMAHQSSNSKSIASQFIQTNFQGTVNLTTALERLETLPKEFVFISTVAVYGKEAGELITEECPLVGNTPYAQSKILAEQHLVNWCNQTGVKLTILRLPLIVGHLPPGNLGKMLTMMRKGLYFRSSEGKARRSMVLAEDVASFILPVASLGGTYNLTDGIHPSLAELEFALLTLLNRQLPPRIPGPLLILAAKVGDILGGVCPLNSEKLSKLNSTLTFSDSKARTVANWKSKPVLENLKLLL